MPCERKSKTFSGMSVTYHLLSNVSRLLSRCARIYPCLVFAVVLPGLISPLYSQPTINEREYFDEFDYRRGARLMASGLALTGLGIAGFLIGRNLASVPIEYNQYGVRQTPEIIRPAGTVCIYVSIPIGTIGAGMLTAGVIKRIRYHRE